MTKTTISFVTQTDTADIKIISDDERNLDSLGNKKSTFLYGDTAYFRIYAENPDDIYVTATDGTVTAHGIFTEDVADETVTFLTENTAETEKTVVSLTSFVWMGKSLGTVTKDGLFSLKCSESPAPAEGKIASASVGYRSAYKLWGLTLPKKSRESYPVSVYAGVKNG